MAGALLVKLFGSLETELENFTDRAHRLRKTVVSQDVLAISFGAGLSLAGSMAVVAIYWLGGLAVLTGGLTLGTLIALATLAQRVYVPVVDLASVRINLTSGLVGFEQEPSDWVLRDLSFAAEPGTMTALVGPTGAGKTTICHLVPRLYEASSGTVFVDGHHVREVTLASLGEAVAMVPQDPHLFHDTVLANLRYARPEARDDEVADACRAARIHDLIDRLPDRYETVVGERGYRFSGGEKQRLAIARALLKDPAILILDEATSHLDSETESLVQEALSALLRGRTSFVIAHRLSTIRQADQILVIEAGRLIDRGTHEQLLERRGLHADLHATQFRAA